MEELRRTGRTTRMLETAIKHATDGEYVMVYARTWEQARQLLVRCVQVADWDVVNNDELQAKIQLKSGGSISFETVEGNRDSGHFDWRTLRPSHIYPGVPVFTDHYAIEGKIDDVHRQIEHLKNELTPLYGEAARWNEFPVNLPAATDVTTETEE